MYAFLATCLVGYVVSQIARRNGQSWPLVDDWGVATFELVASLMCIGRALVGRRGRAIPLVLGIGLLSWSIGDFVLAAETVGGGNPPSPSLADAFYLSFYPFMYVGVMLLIRQQIKHFSSATWLDGAVAGLGAAAICAELASRSFFHLVGGSAAGVATNLAYPVGDLLLLALIVGGSAVLPGRKRGRWLMLAAGCAMNGLGDTFNLFHSSIGATHLGTLFNAVAWPTSILLVSMSVWLRRPPSTQFSHERPPGIALPGIAALSALAILVIAALHGGELVATALAAATLAAAGTRHGLSQLRLRTLTEERHWQAVTDQLTTLGNRRALFELLDGLFAAHKAREPEASDLAFLFVDLNRFKEVNDSFGHSVGDELLRQLGKRLKGSLRDSDLLVRLGGDEFAIALPGANADYGATVAQRIGASIEEPFALGSVRAQISASIGIAVVPSDATNARDLLHCADLAMYRAKLEGKCSAIYTEEVDGHGSRLALLDELRGAIEQRQLELHYQPEVDLRSGEVVTVEALLRWRHPRLGYLPPLEFLPLAEEADLMDALSALVLDLALAQCAAWRAMNESLAVAVNISTTNLLNPAFPRLVQRLLEQHELEPDALVLEITETTAMADLHRCKNAIEELRNLGLVVSVDDFGAGFTSLAYLSSLAVGELKLDRRFIDGLAVAEDARDLALVRSTVALAHALGLRVVAEGVEDQASFDLLVSLDCDLAQGYLISKPKPAVELELQPYPDDLQQVSSGPTPLATPALS